jgi:hypothetical protein
LVQEEFTLLRWRLLPVTFPEFGPFGAVFEKGDLPVPGYLPLLNLNEHREVQVAIDRIQRALQAGDPRRWVTALLKDPNWRPHLVAAIAHLLDRKEKLSRVYLWKAIDSGSWVTPQLIVAAMFSDKAFIQRAIKRVESPGARNGKLLASIFGVSKMVPELGEQLEKWKSNSEVREMLDQDAAWDESDSIAAHWADVIRKHFASRGIVLEPRRKRRRFASETG